MNICALSFFGKTDYFISFSLKLKNLFILITINTKQNGRKTNSLLHEN